MACVVYLGPLEERIAFLHAGEALPFLVLDGHSTATSPRVFYGDREVRPGHILARMEGAVTEVEGRRLREAGYDGIVLADAETQTFGVLDMLRRTGLLVWAENPLPGLDVASIDGVLLTQVTLGPKGLAPRATSHARQQWARRWCEAAALEAQARPHFTLVLHECFANPNTIRGHLLRRIFDLAASFGGHCALGTDLTARDPDGVLFPLPLDARGAVHLLTDRTLAPLLRPSVSMELPSLCALDDALCGATPLPDPSARLYHEQLHTSVVCGQRAPYVETATSGLLGVIGDVCRLRDLGLASNLALATTQERYTGNPLENEVVTAPNARFGAAVAFLRSRVRSLSSPGGWQSHAPLSKFFVNRTHRREFERALLGLCEDLEAAAAGTANARISVWEVDELALKGADGTAYASVAQLEGGVLHCWVSRHHTQPAEALVHAHLRLRHGLSHRASVLLEALARRDLDTSPLLSDTTRGFVGAAPRHCLARLVANTASVVQVHRTRLVVPTQATLFVRQCHAICARAEARLLARPASLDLDTPCEDALGCLLHRASWDPACVPLLASRIAEAPELVPAVLAEARRAGIDEIVWSVHDANAHLVPEPDLAVIYLELNGFTEADILALFGVSKFEVGMEVYAGVRALEREEQGRQAAQHPIASRVLSYRKAPRRALGADYYVRKVSDGLFFMFPVLLNLVLVLCTGLGLHTSLFVDDWGRAALSLAMLLAIIVISAPNNATARLASLYLFQWSFGVMFEVCVRAAVGTAVCAVLAAFALLLPLMWLLLPTAPPSWPLVAAVVCFFWAFCWMLHASTVLFNIHRRSIWRSQAGLAMLVASALQLACNALGFFALDADQRWGAGAGVYVHLAGLAAADLVLVAAAVHQLARLVTAIPGAIALRSDSTVREWYAAQPTGCRPPDLGDKAAATAHDRRARAAFMDAHGTDAPWAEELLVHWYTLQVEVPRPVPFSAAWDGLLAQALDLWKLKTMTDQMHRGGILWTLVAAQVAAGPLYYLLLLADRIIRLGFGVMPQFLAPNSPYEDASAWAFVFLLCAIGLLEPVRARVAARLEAHPPAVIGVGADPLRLARTQGTAEWRAQRGELVRVVVAAAPVGLAASVAYGAVARPGTDPTRWGVFVILCAAYLGFLVGGFAAMQRRGAQAGWATTRHLACSVVVAVVSGVASVLVSGNHDWAAFGLLVGCWCHAGLGLWALGGMAAVTDASRLPESFEQHMRAHALNTSGQRLVGASPSATTAAARAAAIANIEASPPSQRLLVLPQSEMGRAVVAALEGVRGSAVVPQAALVARRAAGGFAQGSVRVWLVSRTLLPAHTAIAQGDAGGGMRVWIGSVLGQPNEHYVPLIAEALVHETAEQQMGWSHQRSVLAELALAGDGGVPVRIARQCERADWRSLRRLLVGTTHAATAPLLARVPFDSDRGWRGLSGGARATLVVVLRVLLHLPLDNPARAMAVLEAAAGGRADAWLSDGLEELGLSLGDVTVAAASAQLALRVEQCAVRALELCEQSGAGAREEDGGPEGDAAGGGGPEGDAAGGGGGGIGMHVGDAMRLAFLAAWGLPEVPQEAGTGGVAAAVRWPLCALYALVTGPVVRWWLRQAAVRWWPGTRLVLAQAAMSAADAAWEARVSVERGEDGRCAIRQRLWERGRTHYWHEEGGEGVVVPGTDHSDPEDAGDVSYRVRRERDGAFSCRWPEGGCALVQLGREGGRVWCLGGGEAPPAHDDTGGHYGPDAAPLEGLLVPDTAQAYYTAFADLPALARVIEYAPDGRAHGVVLRRRAACGMWFLLHAAFAYDASGGVSCRVAHVPEVLVGTTGARQQLPRATRALVGLRWAPHTKLLVAFTRQTLGSPEVTERYLYRHPQHPVRCATVAADGSEATPLLDPWRLRSDLAPLPRIEQWAMLPRPPEAGRSHPLSGIADAMGMLRRLADAGAVAAPLPRVPRLASPRDARSELWALWRRGELAGWAARQLDEGVVRRMRALGPYWVRRRWGRLGAARAWLEAHEHVVAPVCWLPGSKSMRTQYSLKFSDLEEGLVGGGSKRLRVLRADDDRVVRRTTNAMPAFTCVALDSGTWPSDGGGVASCRRDTIDRIDGIRWHAYAEVGHPGKTLNYQVERNVDMMTLVPLWGADVFGPWEHVVTDVPFARIARQIKATTREVVADVFAPLLRSLVDAMFVRFPSRLELDTYGRLLAAMHAFFQRYDWNTTWMSAHTLDVWRRAWIENLTAHAEREALLPRERPSVGDLDAALGLFRHFLTPLGMPVSREASVVHATHHGVQTLLGVVARVRDGTALVIWDHGLMFRERCKAFAEADAFAFFLRHAMVRLTIFSTNVCYHWADAVVSCASFGNPDWQRRLGSGGGSDARAGDMQARMSPIVNGMETDRFAPNRDTEEPLPTAVMLSHVYDLKDVKNAIAAAGIIVNDFAIHDFRLVIYGSLNKDIAYVAECREMITAAGINANVDLAGFGNATKVLQRGWLFLNSSKSEGLPLALGEAGLAGLPVVCTDVGGSREVVSRGQVTYGRIVAPRNPRALATAIIQVLAMLDELDALASVPEDPALPHPLSLADFDGDPVALRARMDDAIDKRRRLGMMYRCFVLESFSISRYIREHAACLFRASFVAQRRKKPSTDNQSAAPQVATQRYAALLRQAQQNRAFWRAQATSDHSATLQSTLSPDLPTLPDPLLLTVSRWESTAQGTTEMMQISSSASDSASSASSASSVSSLSPSSSLVWWSSERQNSESDDSDTDRVSRQASVPQGMLVDKRKDRLRPLVRRTASLF